MEFPASKAQRGVAKAGGASPGKTSTLALGVWFGAQDSAKVALTRGATFQQVSRKDARRAPRGSLRLRTAPRATTATLPFWAAETWAGTTRTTWDMVGGGLAAGGGLWSSLVQVVRHARAAPAAGSVAHVVAL